MFRYNYEDNIHYDVPNCPCCENNMQKLDTASEYLERIVQQLYGPKEIDIKSLDNDLEEICHYLGVRIRREALNITKL